jgi:hypothetical protein
MRGERLTTLIGEVVPANRAASSPVSGAKQTAGQSTCKAWVKLQETADLHAACAQTLALATAVNVGTETETDEHRHRTQHQHLDS